MVAIYSKRLLLAAIVVADYIILWIPTRILLTDKIVHPQTETLATTSDAVTSTMNGGIAADLLFDRGCQQRAALPIRVRLLFFNSDCVAAFCHAAPKAVSDFAGIHLVGSILAYLFYCWDFWAYHGDLLLPMPSTAILFRPFRWHSSALVISGMVEVHTQ
ncbi:MAG: hypothetical protein ACQEST_10200 [Bacteroidota bacterium]